MAASVLHNSPVPSPPEFTYHNAPKSHKASPQGLRILPQSISEALQPNYQNAQRTLRRTGQLKGVARPADRLQQAQEHPTDSKPQEPQSRSNTSIARPTLPRAKTDSPVPTTRTDVADSLTQPGPMLRRKNPVIGQHASARYSHVPQGAEGLQPSYPWNPQTVSPQRAKPGALRSGSTKFPDLQPSALPRTAPTVDKPQPQRSTPISEMSATPPLTFASSSPSMYGFGPSATPQTPYSTAPTTTPPLTGYKSKTSPVLQPSHLPHALPPLGSTDSLPHALPLLKSSSTDLPHALPLAKPSHNKSHASPERSVTGSKSTSSLKKRNSHHAKRISPIHPPELAHLQTADLTPVTSNNSAGSPPPRPSREGASSIEEKPRITPVVQSNLPSLKSPGHRRNLSSDSTSPVKTSPTKAVPANSSPTKAARPLSMSASLSSQKRQSKTPEAASHDRSLTAIQTAQSPQQRPTSKGTSSSKIFSPVEKRSVDETSASRGRFGFLSRKKTPDGSGKVPEEKTARKGPRAGTGHEGYGKYWIRGRSGSGSTNRSTGTISNKSTGAISSVSQQRTSNSSSQPPELDAFLQQRLSPVYLRGESKSTPDGAKSTGDTHVLNATPSLPPQGAFTTFVDEPTSISKAEALGPNPWANVPLSKTHVETQDSRRKLNKTPPLKVFQRSRRNEVDGDTLFGNVDARKNVASSEKTGKGAATKLVGKWNFLQRSKKLNADKQPNKDRSPNQPAMADLQYDQARSRAHYVPQETGQNPEPIDLDAIRRDVQKAQNDDNSSMSTNFEEFEDVQSLEPAKYSEATLALRVAHQPRNSPQPAGSAQRSLSVREIDTHTKPPPETDLDDAADDRGQRPISQSTGSSASPKTDRSRRPHVMSFSRPFESGHPRPSVSSRPESLDAMLGIRSNGQEIDNRQSREVKTESNTDEVYDSGEAFDYLGPLDRLLDSQPRNSSSVSRSSGSSLYHPLSTTIPTSTTNSSIRPAEIWMEYDDLIDHMLDPVSSDTTEPDASSGEPYETYNTSEARHKASRGPLVLNTKLPPAVGRTQRPRFKSSVRYSQIPVPEMFEEPPSPSITQFVARYGSLANNSVEGPELQATGDCVSEVEDNDSNSDYSEEKLDAQADRHTSKALQHKRSISDPGKSNLTHIPAGRKASIWPAQHKMAMFRYHVLMTSKWLSFGRVLLSPVHQRLHGTQDERVLVLDGLGKDWSCYCAQVYSKAQVYSLGPEPSTLATNRQSVEGLPETVNYRHYHHSRLTENFPFPKGFFAAVVLRFPLASSDLALASVVAECKRVLQPGGYLEVTSIDMDLTSIGTLGRRAVRGLKQRLLAYDGRVSLKPRSDEIQNLLGKNGFENLNRCVVNVPVAGVLPGTRENSSDSNDLDITQLATDESKEGDVHITKLVAKVGRWWYTSCYEMPFLPNGDLSQSIWCNRPLLDECEQMQTTFSLLHCYARKPCNPQRRTASM